MEKETPKTTVEILQLFIDNPEKFRSGLCSLAVNLLDDGIINNADLEKFDKHLIRYGPPVIPWGFRWGWGDWPEREKWIKSEIERLILKQKS